jgi:hypothetical protein
VKAILGEQLRAIETIVFSNFTENQISIGFYIDLLWIGLVFLAGFSLELKF